VFIIIIRRRRRRRRTITYGAVIMTKVIARVHPVYLMNAD